MQQWRPDALSRQRHLDEMAPGDWNPVRCPKSQVRDLQDSGAPSRPLQIGVLANDSKARAGPTRDGNASASLVPQTKMTRPRHERQRPTMAGSRTNRCENAGRKA